ncbi:hypothetical protein FRX31_012333 [Thalictrum thalictroides]|uniref:Uncharacterized protein n=1 Tax=Thalictrum thalictroides TaxID=46969 RepID=A0A7J6WPM5_THATH|nr:hypothetical protein FRX31_012333 [Thalictrum thalictroides]
MATGVGGDGLFRCVYEGCISSNDTQIERRPYHRNCKCALHKQRGNGSKSFHRDHKISYPIRRAWSESCLVLSAASCSNTSSPSHSSPANNVISASGVERTIAGVPKEQVSIFEV